MNSEQFFSLASAIACIYSFIFYELDVSFSPFINPHIFVQQVLHCVWSLTLRNIYFLLKAKYVNFVYKYMFMHDQEIFPLL